MSTLGGMSFAHVTKSTPFDTAELALLGRFPIVQFDKTQNVKSMPNVTQEDRFIAAARQIKSLSPSSMTLMYLNGLINFPAFLRLESITSAHPDYLLRNSSGGLVYTGPADGELLTTFDMRNSDMRQAFVADALYGIASKVFDGVFIDRANFASKAVLTNFTHGGWDKSTANSLVSAQRKLLDELQTELGEERIVLAKETGGGAAFRDWEVCNGAMVTDTFCSNYKPEHGNATPAQLFDKDQCLNDILAVQQAAARGQLTQSHGQGPIDDATQREFTMACFLVAAGNMSYFSHADWASAWSLTGTRWWPEYDLPLGMPMGPADRHGHWTFKRTFSSGTKVVLDLEQHTASITWSTGMLFA